MAKGTKGTDARSRQGSDYCARTDLAAGIGTAVVNVRAGGPWGPARDPSRTHRRGFHRPGNHGSAHGQEPAKGRIPPASAQPKPGARGGACRARGDPGLVSGRRGPRRRRSHHHASRLTGRAEGGGRAVGGSRGPPAGRHLHRHEHHFAHRDEATRRGAKPAWHSHVGCPRERRRERRHRGHPLHHGGRRPGGLRSLPAPLRSPWARTSSTSVPSAPARWPRRATRSWWRSPSRR